MKNLRKRVHLLYKGLPYPENISWFRMQRIKFRLVGGKCKLKGRGRISKRVIFVAQCLDGGVFELQDGQSRILRLSLSTNLKWQS